MELIERLRRAGQTLDSDVGELCGEAATALEAAQRENERLKAALRQQSEWPVGPDLADDPYRLNEPFVRETP